MSNTSQKFGMWLPFLLAYCYHPVEGKGWVHRFEKKRTLKKQTVLTSLLDDLLLLQYFHQFQRKNEFNRFKVK